jgi:hypothetical protein
LPPVYESAVQTGESSMKTKHQQAFLQAVTLAADEPNGFKPADVMMVEAMWGATDEDWCIFGFVVSLFSTRRVYLQLIEDFGDAGYIEEVLVLDMIASERFPMLKGLGAVKWHTDTLPELNGLLAA